MPPAKEEKYSASKHLNHRDFAEHIPTGSTYLAALLHWGGDEDKFPLATIKKFEKWENYNEERKALVKSWRDIAAQLGLQPRGYTKINKKPTLILKSTRPYPPEHDEMLQTRNKRSVPGDKEDIDDKKKRPAKARKTKAGMTASSSKSVTKSDKKVKSKKTDDNMGNSGAEVPNDDNEADSEEEETLIYGDQIDAAKALQGPIEQNLIFQWMLW